MPTLYERIIEAENDARGRDPWEQRNPHRTEKYLPIKRKLEREGIWVTDAESCPAALIADLSSIKKAWRRFRADRKRDAVYGYLQAVFELVNRWLAQGTGTWNSKRIQRLHRCAVT